MPVFCECPACGKRYRFQDDMAGERVPCRECGETIRVPGRRRSPRRTGLPLSPALIAGGAFALVLSVGLFLTFRSGGGDPAPVPPNPVAGANSSPDGPAGASSVPARLPALPGTAPVTSSPARLPEAGTVNPAMPAAQPAFPLAGTSPPANSNTLPVANSSSGSPSGSPSTLEFTQWNVQADPPQSTVNYSAAKIDLLLALR